jgi:hypothetical protein
LNILGKELKKTKDRRFADDCFSTITSERNFYSRLEELALAESRDQASGILILQGIPVFLIKF